MDQGPPPELTVALEAAGRGEPDAAARLLPLVYEELRRLAGARMRRIPPGQTLQATALVHEAWLRVARDRGGPPTTGTGRSGPRDDPRPWNSRGHFFAAAARAMRDILVEEHRRKSRLKRGGDRQRVDLAGEAAEAALAIEPPTEDVVALDAALDRLEQVHPEHAHVVMLRYFVGLTAPQTADVLDTSLSSVERSWRFARAWLRQEMTPGEDADGA